MPTAMESAIGMGTGSFRAIAFVRRRVERRAFDVLLDEAQGLQIAGAALVLRDDVERRDHVRVADLRGGALRRGRPRPSLSSAR